MCQHVKVFLHVAAIDPDLVSEPVHVGRKHILSLCHIHQILDNVICTRVRSSHDRIWVSVDRQGASVRAVILSLTS